MARTRTTTRTRTKAKADDTEATETTEAEATEAEPAEDYPTLPFPGAGLVTTDQLDGAGIEWDADGFPEHRDHTPTGERLYVWSDVAHWAGLPELGTEADDDDTEADDDG